MEFIVDDFTEQCKDIVEQLPMDVYVKLKSLAFSYLIVCRLKHKRSSEQTANTHLHAEGMELCQTLINEDLADESLTTTFEKVYSDEFRYMPDHYMLAVKKVVKHVCKHDLGLINAIPVHEVKAPLLKLAEIYELKNAWKATRGSHDDPLNVFQYLVKECQDTLSQFTS